MKNYNTYSSVLESFSEIHHVLESSSFSSINRMPLTPLQEWANTYKQSYVPLSKTNFGFQLPQTIINGLQDMQLNSTDFLSRLQNILNNDESDYVIVNEKPVKEIGIPDSFGFRVGNYRFKMNTGTFLSIVFFLIGYVIPSESTVNTNQVQIYVQTSQQPSYILDSLFKSVDTSPSVHTDFIEFVREIVEAVLGAAEYLNTPPECSPESVEGPEESVATSLQAADNMKTSDNTESGNQ